MCIRDRAYSGFYNENKIIVEDKDIQNARVYLTYAVSEDVYKRQYIRSLCEDIAIKFGTVGYMKSLKRIQVGDFKIEDRITIDELNNIIQKNELDKTKTIITLEKLFEKIPSIRLDNRKLELFLNGVKMCIRDRRRICKRRKKLLFKDIYRQRKRYRLKRLRKSK